MEKVVHMVELLIATLGLAGVVVTAWVAVNLRVNTNRERIRSMEARIDEACMDHTEIRQDIKGKADKQFVDDVKNDLLRELGGKIDNLQRLIESIAKKNGID